MEKGWYVIRTHVGYEQSAKAALLREIPRSDQDKAFGQILVPTEKISEVIRGKKRITERCLFPGYILAQLALDKEALGLVRSVPKIVGFVGENDPPTKLSESEIQKLLNRIEAGMNEPRPKFSFSIGEQIKVVDGPFRDFTGIVESLKPERSRARVTVSVFGRQTPVELDFHQLEAA